jgi:hypothetical protein
VAQQVERLVEVRHLRECLGAPRLGAREIADVIDDGSESVNAELLRHGHTL